MLESGSSGSVRGVLSNEHPYREPGSNPDFLLGGRTSASAECRHWSGRAVRWSGCTILLSSIVRSSARPRARRRSPVTPHSSRNANCSRSFLIFLSILSGDRDGRDQYAL